MDRLPIIFCLLVVLAGSVSAGVEKSMPEFIAERWIEETEKSWQLIDGRCWRESKNAEIKSTLRAAYELDLVYWLDAEDQGGQRAKYARLYETSYRGLTDRLKISNCRLRTKKALTATSWTNFVFDCEGAETLEYRMMMPVDLHSHRNNLDDQLSSLLEIAAKNCINDETIPTSSLGHLLFAGLRQTPDAMAVRAVNATLLVWQKAIRLDDETAARQRLEQLAKQLGQLRYTAYQRFAGSLDEPVRKKLVEAAFHRIKVLEERKISASRKLREIWTYQSLVYLEGREYPNLKQYLDRPGNDPLLEFTIRQTAELLYYSEMLARQGKSNAAANIITRLLLWELGTENTGLHMMRPIDIGENIITPYPIWLALVPPYKNLTDLMNLQSGQLTAEQYKTARMLSRDQYISGISEQGFWNLFEQVVWK